MPGRKVGSLGIPFATGVLLTVASSQKVRPSLNKGSQAIKAFVTPPLPWSCSTCGSGVLASFFLDYFFLHLLGGHLLHLRLNHKNTMVRVTLGMSTVSDVGLESQPSLFGRCLLGLEFFCLVWFLRPVCSPHLTPLLL